MTTFIKAKRKKSDDQTNIGSCKYYIEYHIKINLPKNHHSKIYDDKAIISCKNVCIYVKNQHV